MPEAKQVGILPDRVILPQFSECVKRGPSKTMTALGQFIRHRKPPPPPPTPFLPAPEA